MRIVNRVAALAIAALAIGAWAQEDQNLDARPATAAAEAWLEHVDLGRYGDSWEAAAATFKEAFPRVRWEASIQDARAKLGVVVKRKLRSARSATELPNAPPGEYVVIENDTRFENRALSTETVTLMKQKDGSWRVAGYFIH